MVPFTPSSLFLVRGSISCVLRVTSSFPFLSSLLLRRQVNSVHSIKEGLQCPLLLSQLELRFPEIKMEAPWEESRLPQNNPLSIHHRLLTPQPATTSLIVGATKNFSLSFSCECVLIRIKRERRGCFLFFPLLLSLFSWVGSVCFLASLPRSFPLSRRQSLSFVLLSFSFRSPSFSTIEGGGESPQHSDGLGSHQANLCACSLPSAQCPPPSQGQLERRH